MEVLDIMRARTSRRSYTSSPIPKDSIEKLQDTIEYLNRKSGLHIQLVLDGEAAFKSFKKTYGMFSGVKHYFAMVGNSSDPLLHEKVGYYGEYLVLVATELGLGTCWVGSSYDAQNCNCEILAGEQLVCVITVGQSPESLSSRERLVLSMVKEKSKKYDELCQYDKQPPEWFWDGMKAVELAPSARNRQPVQIIYYNDVIYATTGQFQYNKIDMGIAKLHFALGAGGRFELGEHGRFYKDEETV